MALSKEEIVEIATAVADKVVEQIREQDYSNLMLHSIVYIHGSPGVVVDEATARNTSCTCYGPICFSRGIIGALSESQKEWACNPRIEAKSPGMERRLKNWREAVSICKAEIEAIPKGERLEPWLSCMSRELPKHGIEI